MYREPLDYADNYKLIESLRPNPEQIMFKATDIAKMLGISAKTAARKFKYNNFKQVSIASLARQMSVL